MESANDKPVKYSFVNDENYFLALQSRFRHRVIQYAGAIKIFLAIALTFGIAIPLRLHGYDWSIIGVGTVLVCMLVFGVRLKRTRRKAIPRSWRRSPFFNTRATACLGESLSYSFSTRIEVDRFEGNMSWSGITKAKSFRDGLLVFFSARQMLWLPDQCLTSGTADEARELVRRHVTNYATINFPKIPTVKKPGR